MPLEYYLNSLDSTTFQRLINALLIRKWGEKIRVTPLRGADGGRDAETAPSNDQLLFEANESTRGFLHRDPALEKGRYLFQAKHHRTQDIPGTTVRGKVLSDFQTEITRNVLPRTGDEAVDYFFLITNVPSSREALTKLDEVRSGFKTERPHLHADVLWQEHVTAWLDESPQVWSAFPDLFAGRVVPGLGSLVEKEATELDRSVRLALSHQFRRDGTVRFQQVDLEQNLERLFIDLDVDCSALMQPGMAAETQNRYALQNLIDRNRYFHPHHGRLPVSSLSLLTLEDDDESQQATRKLEANDSTLSKIILEGGPGQGKSTITQMLAQLYRAQLLQEQSMNNIIEGPRRARIPFRIELRLFAEWLDQDDGSLEQFLARSFSKDSGGRNITVENIASLVTNSPVLIICDGLDEVGRDDLRDTVLTKICECINRFEHGLNADIKAVITTRPPAIAGKGGKLSGFVGVQVLPLDAEKITLYLERWTTVLCPDREEQSESEIRLENGVKRYTSRLSRRIRCSYQCCFISFALKGKHSRTDALSCTGNTSRP